MANKKKPEGRAVPRSRSKRGGPGTVREARLQHEAAEQQAIVEAASAAAADAKRQARQALEALASAAATLESGALFASLLAAIAALFRLLRTAALAPASRRGPKTVHGIDIPCAVSVIGASALSADRTVRRYVGATLNLVATLSRDQVQWVTAMLTGGLLTVRQALQLSAIYSSPDRPSSVDPVSELIQLVPDPNDQGLDQTVACATVKAVIQRAREQLALALETSSPRAYFEARDRDLDMVREALSRIKTREALALEKKVDWIAKPSDPINLIEQAMPRLLETKE